MAAPKTQTINDKLLKDLAHLRDSNRRDMFTLVRLKSEADKLMNANPIHALIVKGAVACLEGDIEGMHDYHKRAIVGSGSDLDSLFNYAASLSECGEHELAIEYAGKAYERSPDYLPTIAVFATAYYALGNVEESSRFIQKYEVLSKMPFPDPLFPEDNEVALGNKFSEMDEQLAAHKYVDADLDDFNSMLELVSCVE